MLAALERFDSEAFAILETFLRIVESQELPAIIYHYTGLGPTSPLDSPG